MKKKHWTTLGLALGVLVLGMLVGLMTVGTVAADPTPGVKIQLPRIDVGDVLGTGPWETWIQVQNVSIDDTDTGAIFLGWGDYSGLCPTNDPGVIVHYCQLIRGNAIWTLRTQLATDTKSAIIYTVREDVFMEACSDAELTEGNTDMWREWLKEWEFGTGMDITKDPAVPMTWGPAQGEEVAVTATRYGPNDYGTFVSSTYTGISREMEGDDSAPYDYYAPYVMKGYNGLDTELTIQNSGEACTSVWIDYMEQGSCAIVYKHHVEQLAPGEAIRLRVPCNVGQIPCGWLGSAHISAEVSLGIIVDETSFDEPCMGVDRGTLLTHRARPKEEFRDGEPIEDTKVYADLIFREWSGWESSIQVQNLSREGLNTFVTVDFMDNSGDEILFLADWVCPGGSTTFYLPIVTDLLPGYVGAAEIESHDQVNYPGGTTDAQPIFAVVDLKKPDNPLTPEMDAQGGSYNAHPYSQKEWVSQIALPFIAKDAYGAHPWTSLIAIRNNSNCNKIKPMIHFKDETGTVVCEIPSFWIRPKQVKLFDLNNIGCLYPGYIGAAKVYVNEFEQLCDVDQDGHVDNEPLMPSVIVVERGILGLPYGGGGVTALADTWGDVTSIYEGIPYAKNIPACYGDIFGTVSVRQENHGFDRAEINGATVSLVTFEAGPFTVDGRAYVGPACAGSNRLNDAEVELQVLTCQAGADDDECDGDFDDAWVWEKDGDTTTSSAGFFAFADALEFETRNDDLVAPDDNDCTPGVTANSPTACWEDGDEIAYRLKIFVEEPPGSYISDVFNDLGDWVSNFHIDTTGVGGELDFDTGEWCDLEYTPPAIASDEVVGNPTNSNGGYQAKHVPADSHYVAFSKTDFFWGLAAATVECGKETQLDYELICSNPLFVTVEDTSGNPIPGATVTVSATYEYNADTDETYVTTGETDNAGEATIDVAGAADLDLEVSAAGHDTYVFGAPNEVEGKDGGTEENRDCYRGGTVSTLDAGVQLCKWNTIVGTATIGGHAAVGYVAKAVDMSVNPPAVVDSNTTTAGGVFSLQKFSAAHDTYRIQLWSPSDTLISTTGTFNVGTHCGDTGVITYTSGTWDPISW